MARETRHENFRVVIELDGWGSHHTSDRKRSECEEIVKQVKRHVDGIGSTYVESDTAYVCGHCGDPWTEDSRTYNGGCCEQDEAANPADTPAA